MLLSARAVRSSRRILAFAVLAVIALLAMTRVDWSHSPTEAAGNPPEMHIVLPGVACTGTPGAVPPNLKCTIAGPGAGVGLSFQVQIRGFGANIGGFQSEIFLGGLAYTSKSCLVEVTMQPTSQCVGPTVGAGGQVMHGNATGPAPPYPAWSNPPNLVNMPNVSCPGPGQFKLTLTAAPNSPQGSQFTDTNGNPILIKTRTTQSVDLDGPGGNPPVQMPVADTVLVNCTFETQTPLPPTATPFPTFTPTPPPSPTPTATPPYPGVRLSPSLLNLFLTRQGNKIPPANCLDGDDTVVLTQTLNSAVTGTDKHGDPRSLGGFSFRVKYDPTKVCVTLAPVPGALNQGMLCTVFDALTAPTLQGAATMFCVTAGKNVSPPVTNDLEIAQVIVRPQPEVYSLAKPNNGNGQVAQLLSTQCKLTDRQGDPIAVSKCTDADVTMRYLEGDVEPDCVIDGLDTQAIAFRWGAHKGALLFNDRFNLEPSGALADNDIDVNDLQFVYGRILSTCDNPQELATPVNPKA